jgi:hypothetical protein
MRQTTRRQENRRIPQENDEHHAKKMNTIGKDERHEEEDGRHKKEEDEHDEATRRGRTRQEKDEHYEEDERYKKEEDAHHEKLPERLTNCSNVRGEILCLPPPPLLHKIHERQIGNAYQCVRMFFSQHAHTIRPAWDSPGRPAEAVFSRNTLQCSVR